MFCIFFMKHLAPEMSVKVMYFIGRKFPVEANIFQVMITTCRVFFGLAKITPPASNAIQNLSIVFGPEPILCIFPEYVYQSAFTKIKILQYKWIARTVC